MLPLTLISLYTFFSSLFGSATAQIPNVVYKADFRSPLDIKYLTPFYEGYSAYTFKLVSRYNDPATRELVRNSMRYRPYDPVQKRLSRSKSMSTSISTSSNTKFPMDFAVKINHRRRIHIYYIDTSGTDIVDVAAEYKKLGEDYPFPDEAEFLVLSKVPWRKIVGWIEFEPVGMESTLDVLGTGPSRTRKTSKSTFYANEAYRGTVKVDKNGNVMERGALNGGGMQGSHVGTSNNRWAYP